MRIKFYKDSLAAEQNNYITKFANPHIIYDLDPWPRNPTNNFKLKKCLSGATNILKNNNKEKWMYRSYGIVFDGAGSWNFGNARNVVIFSVDNSSSGHPNNFKNNYLVLSERRTSGINGSSGSPEKKFNINFSKAK